MRRCLAEQDGPLRAFIPVMGDHSSTAKSGHQFAEAEWPQCRTNRNVSFQERRSQ
jgi:hypothetical protein